MNKTESAIRLTHIPTGIIVECQNERNQHQNMQMAMELLQAKLDLKNSQIEETKRREVYESKDDNSWSNQIRSYIMHPYSMVKDHIYGVTDNDVQGILNGNLKEFIEEVMRRKMYSDFGIASFTKG